MSPSVLITDAEERAALAACRALDAVGYEVVAAASRRPAVSHWSRSVSQRVTLPDPRDSVDLYIERLVDLLQSQHFDVLLPVAEASLLPISERRNVIEPYVRLGLPPHEVVCRAVDKLLLQEEASAVDLAPPASIVCVDGAEAVAAASELGFPVLAKPARSFTEHGKGLKQEVPRVVDDESALLEAVAALGAPLTVQAFVAGAGLVSFAGVRAAGELLGLTVARYQRTFPVRVGSASMALTIEPPGELTERVNALLGRIGWEGIFELELLELGSGRYAAIDLNPRPFGWMTLCAGAGANLAALWCDRVLGRPAVSRPARAGVRYRWEDAEVRNMLIRLRGGDLGALGVLRPHLAVVHALFRLDDPGPLVARLLFLAAEFLRRKRRGAPGEQRGAKPRLQEPVSAEQPDAGQRVGVGAKLARP